MLTLHACCLINRTAYALGKNAKNLFVFLEIDVLKSVLFSNVELKCSTIEAHLNVAEW